MRPDELEAALADTQPADRDAVANRTTAVAVARGSAGEVITEPGEPEPRTEPGLPAVERAAEEPVTEPEVAAVTRDDRRRAARVSTS